MIGTEPPHILSVVIRTGQKTKCNVIKAFTCRWMNQLPTKPHPLLPPLLLPLSHQTLFTMYSKFVKLSLLQFAIPSSTFEGLTLIETLMSPTELAKRMASRSTAATGRVILGTMQIKRLQALVYWVKDHEKRGLNQRCGQLGR